MRFQQRNCNIEKVSILNETNTLFIWLHKSQTRKGIKVIIQVKGLHIRKSKLYYFLSIRKKIFKATGFISFKI